MYAGGRSSGAELRVGQARSETGRSRKSGKNSPVLGEASKGHASLRRCCLWPPCVDLEGKTAFLYLSFLVVLSTVSTSVNG